MVKYIGWMAIFLILSASVLSCTGPNVTFEDLLSSPEKYNGKDITLEGFYFGGFEASVFSEALKSYGYADGQLAPEGPTIWVEGEIPKDVFDGLYKQQQNGYNERYGKLRISGKFQYGQGYGHLGRFNYQITVKRAELLQWSPSSSLIRNLAAIDSIFGYNLNCTAYPPVTNGTFTRA